MPSIQFEQIRSPLRPVDAFDRMAAEEGAFFLDSALRSPRQGRYSFLGCRPFLVVESTGRNVEITCRGATQLRRGNPFNILRELLHIYRVPAKGCPVPFAGGAVGYFGYDLCHHIETLPKTAVADIALPQMHLGFYDAIMAYDNIENDWWLCGIEFDGCGKGRSLRSRFDELAELLGRHEPSLAAIEQATAPPSIEPPVPFARGDLQSNFSRDDYIDAVRRTKEYIAAGDIFQANISQRFSIPINTSPYSLYRRLRETNPAPFAAYIDLGPSAVASSSPERFLKVARDDDANLCVETRPIKGTRPRRDGDDAFNERMQAELLESAKDDAELTMIVDLERNDLGRVCRYGSVRVTDRTALEEYASVYHLVATIEGKLHPRYDIIDLIKSTFPGGSITGAPKVRSMEIIDELEPTCRSVYTGSIGYIGFDGTADLNIAIRTMIIEGRGGDCSGGANCWIQVGGGIVADSVPELEYRETLDKGRAMFRALGRGHSVDEPSAARPKN